MQSLVQLFEAQSSDPWSWSAMLKLVKSKMKEKVSIKKDTMFGNSFELMDAEGNNRYGGQYLESRPGLGVGEVRPWTFEADVYDAIKASLPKHKKVTYRDIELIVPA